MKKMIILVIKGSVIGGVWSVNETLANEFVKMGYEVQIVSCRDKQYNDNLNNGKIKLITINEKGVWERPLKREVINYIKKFKIIKAIKTYVNILIHDIGIKKDMKKISDYLIKENPDAIITSFYNMLDAVPKSLLKRVINVQHSSFDYVLSKRDNYNQLLKYNDLIFTNAWLCNNSCKMAIENGITNSTYIYNPIKFLTDESADVVKNRKLITISRLDADQKRIDLMVRIADKVLRKDKFKDWCLELYGAGTFDDETMNIVKNNKRIKLMGITKDAKSKLLLSSIYLSTSYMEGFSMSILEAYECGLPVVSYDFGESCSEQIINNKTGIIVPFNDEKKFIENLENLMDDSKKLSQYGKNAKKFANNFEPKIIAKKWDDLINEINK